ncbi:MAG: hypothetical protein NTZ73_00215 [Candidatus Diapherotrites archaeon]|nr:hypothetical protein [Candidatus Diapherotrites archaeon]
MYEDLAVDYFRGLSSGEKKKLIKKIFDSLTEKEKLEIAKMLVKG